MNHELISEHHQRSSKRFNDDTDHHRNRRKRLRYDYRCKSQYDDEYNNYDSRRHRSNSRESKKQRRSRSLRGKTHKKESDSPAKLKMMLVEMTNKSSEEYQRIAWEALEKSIHGCVNKVNFRNIGIIARELFRENIVRGRDLLAKSIIQAQATSPIFTPAYAALMSVINSKFPSIGELLLKRLITQFKQSFKSNNKPLCISSATFIAHLVNQGVAHETLALELLFLLIETPTDDSVEVVIAFLKECGIHFIQVLQQSTRTIIELLRAIPDSCQLHKRVECMIEGVVTIRKDGFKDHIVSDELNFVEKENQFTHIIKLDEAVKNQDAMDVFKFDAEYSKNEEKYQKLMEEILGTDESSSNDGDEEDSFDGSEDEAETSNISHRENFL